MANKRGAPKKPPDERKGDALQVRLTGPERAACEAAAAASGQKMSAWARAALVKAAKPRKKAGA